MGVRKTQASSNPERERRRKESFKWHPFTPFLAEEHFRA